MTGFDYNTIIRMFSNHQQTIKKFIGDLLYQRLLLLFPVEKLKETRLETE